MGRKIVGGAAGGRRNQDAVADQFVHADFAVDDDPELGGLIDLPEQRHLVDGERFVRGAVPLVRRHAQGVNDGALGRLQPLLEVVLMIIVEQEADGAPVHAVDRRAAVEMAMHGLQHQPVAAQRDDGIGRGDGSVAVALRQRFERLLCLLGLAGNEGDLVEAGHDPVEALGAWVRSGHYKRECALQKQVPRN